MIKYGLVRRRFVETDTNIIYASGFYIFIYGMRTDGRNAAGGRNADP